MTTITLRLTSEEALHSAISYCRCEGLHYSVGLYHDEATFWRMTICNAGGIDRRTLALYGQLSETMPGRGQASG